MSKNNAVIFGFSGLELTKEEISFFKKAKPEGFILFKRNIDSKEQVKKLVVSLKEIAGFNCPILIDQEGGRVARLTPPVWKKYPPMQVFAEDSDESRAAKDIFNNAAEIGADLEELGINVDCAPVCDLLFADAHDIVGDRSFGSDPEKVARLARKMADGLISRKIIPIIKHIPGHGRAKVDSHKDLPIVSTSYSQLLKTDFKPFKLLNDMPWAMTAHIKYTDIDAAFPATQSEKLIGIIRQEIGFDGVLISDDLSMEALGGSYKERAELSLAAGCDLVLHCNGKMDEMTEVMKGVGEISDEAQVRLNNSYKILL